MIKVMEMEYEDAMEKAHDAIDLMEGIAHYIAKRVPERLHSQFYDEIRCNLFK